MATLKDVAERAGVSVRTVSNVVNGWPHVRPALRAKVQAVIDELGYEPNLAARSLRSGRSGLIALVVPELDAPYFAELARCVVDELSARGITAVIEQSDGKIERERELLARNSRASLFDGIIFSPLAMSSAEIELHRSKTPLVLLGEQHLGMLDHVLIDNVAAAQIATQHLLDLGRRRVALIGAQPDAGMNTSRLRVEGYKAALRAAGLEPDPDLMQLTKSFHRVDGEEAMAALLDLPERPDAVFCLNDLLAVGALRAMRARGLAVPDDIALVGFDDIEEGQYAAPSLTTVSPDKSAIASAAVRLLLARVEGSTEPATLETVPFTFKVRESTAGAPCRGG